MAGLGLVAAGRRGRRAFAAPAAFLLAVTVAVVVFHSTGHHASPPAKSLVIQTKLPVAPLPRFYRVAAGDTMVGIAAKTHVPLVRLRTLNPGLQPTALFIGEKIRLR